MMNLFFYFGKFLGLSTVMILAKNTAIYRQRPVIGSFAQMKVVIALPTPWCQCVYLLTCINLPVIDELSVQNIGFRQIRMKTAKNSTFVCD